MARRLLFCVGWFLLLIGAAYGACTPQEIRDLTAAGFTTPEINEVCPICSPQDKIKAAQADKTKAEISAICSDRKLLADFLKKENEKNITDVSMSAANLLVGKAFSLGFDMYHSSKALKEDDNETTTHSKHAEDLFKIYLRYTLPISSMVYAFDENRPDKPHPLLKAFKVYAEGNFSNTISSDNGSTGLSLKTDNTLFYNVGFKFETDFDTLFSRGKTYKYYSNY